MAHITRVANVVGASIALVAATAAINAATQSKWLLTFALSEKGAHVVGSPTAPTKVVEYLSYTCGHCANFEINETPMFKTQYVATGKASLEIRNFILNPFDLTAAMLARCGGKGRFFGNHKHLFATQAQWTAKTSSLSAATKSKLQAEDYVGFMTGVYIETGLVAIMQQRGITQVQGKACLADRSAFNTIISMTEEAERLGIKGTPTFLINGKVQDHIHDFQSLKSKLK
ncbi:MAG: thioredoxin domain-containing protein [Sphingorhabdus sp.]